MNRETLEEAAEKYADFSNDYVPLAFGSKFNETTKRDFIEGAKWQAKKMYSEENMIAFHKWAYFKNRFEESDKTTKELLSEWLEQYKKK
jgi:hypothetical protein